LAANHLEKALMIAGSRPVKFKALPIDSLPIKVSACTGSIILRSARHI
jgi:hypothetical protein